jgi:hypothetical protein
MSRGADLAGVPTSPPVPPLTFTPNRARILDGAEAFAPELEHYLLLLPVRLRSSQGGLYSRSKRCVTPSGAQLRALVGDTTGQDTHCRKRPKKLFLVNPLQKLLRKSPSVQNVNSP